MQAAVVPQILEGRFKQSRDFAKFTWNQGQEQRKGVHLPRRGASPPQPMLHPGLTSRFNLNRDQVLAMKSGDIPKGQFMRCRPHQLAVALCLPSTIDTLDTILDVYLNNPQLILPL